MPYNVQFVGLVCFLRDGNGRQVLLPDGREPGHGIDPHYASIVVANDAVAGMAGWSDGEVPLPGTFIVPPSSIAIEGANVHGLLDTRDHDGWLPELRRIDPNFEIDLQKAETIATLRVAQGRLQACRVPGGSAVISELLVPHDGPIRVTVVARDGSAERTIDLRAGTEIAIANTARAGYVGGAEHNDHFRIYEKLSVRPVTLTEPPAETLKRVPRSQSRHAMFTRRAPIGLTVSCSNTGCCT